MSVSAPKRNQAVVRQQKVGTIHVTVNSNEDVTKVCHRILAFIKTVDRQGVVQVFLDGKPAKAKASKPAKVADESLLD
jgi:hypothetical protein